MFLSIITYAARWVSFRAEIIRFSQITHALGRLVPRLWVTLTSRGAHVHGRAPNSDDDGRLSAIARRALSMCGAHYDRDAPHDTTN